MKKKRYMAVISLFLLLMACQTLPSSSPDGAVSGHRKERVQRYEPENGDFKITNGKLKFNRALYGTNTAFRIEGGDLPEFAFYMPGMGGNCQLAMTDGKKTLKLSESSQIITRYRPGALIYEISDPLLQGGKLILTAIAMADEEGLILKADFRGIPENLRLLTLYGGASDRKFSRSGDLNADPADAFFMKPENCEHNHYALKGSNFSMVYGRKLSLTPEEIRQIQTDLAQGILNTSVQGKKYNVLAGAFPEHTSLSIVDAGQLSASFRQGSAADTGEIRLPVLRAETAVAGDTSLFICLHRPKQRLWIRGAELPGLYAQAESKRAELAGRLVIHTPDSFLNTLGGVISTVGDAIYEYPSYLHGAISWRMRLNGWRGAYVADVLGWHDRAKNHFSAYAESQLVSPVSGPVETDTVLNQTRSRERLGNAMFSSGYICRNPGGDFRPHHYDMNLVFIDQLLNHFAWTGDLRYLKEMWPVIERHLDWEKRVFDPDGDGLYDAYACIWASDGLMYNGGGVTHSSAYNYKAHKIAAGLARKIGRDPRPYLQEAEKIGKAIRQQLWLSHQGQWAEFKDAAGRQQVHPAAGVWTVYHAIDSKVPDDFEAYQALRYIDNGIPHIPFLAKGFENEGYSLVSTTNWMPYSWSVNNVALAELMHTSLAYWQGNRPEEGFKLWKAAILDAMYCGMSPGNIGQISFYDAARGETYRDFADPAGMAARTVVEGLFGIQPDLMNDRLLIRPGFPGQWEYASVHLPYLDFHFQVRNDTSHYMISPRMQQAVNLTLEVRAMKDQVRFVHVNGQPVDYRIQSEAIGQPAILLELPAEKQYDIAIGWAGHPVSTETPEISAAINELNIIQFKNDVTELKDPQQLISDQEISDSHVQVRLQGEPGEHTFFAHLRQGEMSWWQPVHVHLGKAVEIIPAENESPDELCFYIRNNSERELKGKIVINPGVQEWQQELKMPAKTTGEVIRIPARYALKGSNRVQVHFSGKVYEKHIVNWEIPFRGEEQFITCPLTGAFNDKVTQIFRNRYLSPRSPYTTLQLPVQGIGEWCHPKLTAQIDDSGLRRKAEEDIFTTPFGLPFYTPADSSQHNIAFVSLWDNYPGQFTFQLKGKAAHAYFMMAGSTNHMQSQFDNGELKIFYKDGGAETLMLRNPETWAPIERDYYIDGYAFAMQQARPYRIVLKTGETARNLEDQIKGKKLDERYIPGGGAIILDLPLDPSRELDRLELKALANDVVIGLMGVTLMN